MAALSTAGAIAIVPVLLMLAALGVQICAQLRIEIHVEAMPAAPCAVEIITTVHVSEFLIGNLLHKIHV